MAILRLASMVLRVAEIVFAAIVAGITGAYLHAVKNTDSWEQGRFIYTEVVAGLSILLALIWLFPFSSTFIHWPADFLMSVMWFVAFGLMVHWLDGSCGYVFDWNNIAIRGETTCAQWKADIAFAFLSAIVWLASAIVGILWTRRNTARAPAVVPATTTHRRRWYRRSYV